MLTRDTIAPKNVGGQAAERILEVLAKYLPGALAKTILDQAEKGNRKLTHLNSEDVSHFFAAIEQGSEKQLDRMAYAKLRGELRVECHLLTKQLGKETLSVREEWQVGSVRARVGQVIKSLGGNPFQVTAAATIASELARNIILYTPGGVIELEPSQSPRRLLIRSVDEGTGIPNIEHVLSGKYQSKTGLGRGLAGSKKLAYKFEVQTGAHGTRIEAEVRL